jgi:hypothetical protein
MFFNTVSYLVDLPANWHMLIDPRMNNNDNNNTPWPAVNSLGCTYADYPIILGFYLFLYGKANLYKNSYFMLEESYYLPN